MSNQLGFKVNMKIEEGSFFGYRERQGNGLAVERNRFEGWGGGNSLD